MQHTAGTGFFWYGELRGSTRICGRDNSSTDGSCDPLGINFPTGTFELRIDLGPDRVMRSIRLRPRTFVQYDVMP
jgi:hypothetical protein